MTRKYELVVIFKPDLEEKKNSLLKTLQELLSKENISVASEAWWGKKPLSYPIASYQQGLYLFFELTSKKQLTEALISELKNIGGIIRHLLVRKEE